MASDKGDFEESVADPEAFQADVEQLMQKHGLTSLLLLYPVAGNRDGLTQVSFCNRPADSEALDILFRAVDRATDDVQDEVNAALRKAHVSRN